MGLHRSQSRPATARGYRSGSTTLGQSPSTMADIASTSPAWSMSRPRGAVVFHVSLIWPRTLRR
jgi:hypothetical protein